MPMTAPTSGSPVMNAAPVATATPHTPRAFPPWPLISCPTPGTTKLAAAGTTPLALLCFFTRSDLVMIDCGTCRFLVEKHAIFVRLRHARTLPVAHREARAHANPAPE